MKLTKPQETAIAAIQAGLPAGCTLTIGAATTLSVVEDTEGEDEDPPEEEEEVKETAAAKKKRIAAEKKAAAAAKKKGDDGDEVTLKELRALARPIVKDGRGSEVAEILEEFEAESLTKLDEDNYAEMKERLEELGD